MELEELEKDPRFENLVQRAINSKELVPILESRFTSKTSDEWVEVLQKAELLCCRVNTIPELINDPQVTANNYITEYDHPALGKVNMVGFPIHMSETPLSVRMPAPELGQHTEEVLLELGYSWEDIVKLREEEVI
jgi:crotonobetainyl-CoA:carnitine CoA-transferase CaiB-like acyl-CoA transferase